MSPPHAAPGETWASSGARSPRAQRTPPWVGAGFRPWCPSFPRPRCSSWGWRVPRGPCSERWAWRCGCDGRRPAAHCRAPERATPGCLSFEVSHGARIPGGPSVPQQSFRPPAQKPRVSESDFEDLLSTQGFSSKADRRGPRTIAEMRRQDQARDTDPLKLKVRGGRRGGRGSPGHLCSPRLSNRTARPPQPPWGPGVRREAAGSLRGPWVHPACTPNGQ